MATIHLDGDDYTNAFLCDNQHLLHLHTYVNSQTYIWKDFIGSFFHSLYGGLTLS